MFRLPLLFATIALLAGCSGPGFNSERRFKRELMVSSNFIWQHTFIYCKPGDIVSITADKGSWQTDQGACGAGGIPDTLSDKNYLFPGVPQSALIGKLGQKIFLVGASCRHLVDKDEIGELKLSCNSCPGEYDTGNEFNANHGEIKALVTVIRSSSDSESPLRP